MLCLPWLCVAAPSLLRAQGRAREVLGAFLRGREWGSAGHWCREEQPHISGAFPSSPWRSGHPAGTETKTGPACFFAECENEDVGFCTRKEEARAAGSVGREEQRLLQRDLLLWQGELPVLPQPQGLEMPHSGLWLCWGPGTPQRGVGTSACCSSPWSSFNFSFFGCPLSTAGLPNFELLFCKWKMVPEGVGKVLR